MHRDSTGHCVSPAPHPQSLCCKEQRPAITKLKGNTDLAENKQKVIPDNVSIRLVEKMGTQPQDVRKGLSLQQKTCALLLRKYEASLMLDTFPWSSSRLGLFWEKMG